MPYVKLKPGPGGSASRVARHQLARIHSAMNDLVADRGYGAVTLRKLARVAGISTRTFYEHYAGKRDCFWGAYDLTIRRTMGRIEAAQAGVVDERSRLERSIEAIVVGWAADPNAARLILLDAYLVGSGAAVRARGTRLAIELCLHMGTTRPYSPSQTSVAAIVAAIFGASRSRLLRDESLTGLEGPLAAWGVSQIDAASEKQILVRLPAAQGRRLRSAAQVGTDDAALLLSAVSRLVFAKRFEELTASDVCAAAGISRRRLSATFPSLEDAVIAAAKLHEKEFLSHIRARCESAESVPFRMGIAVSELCAWATESEFGSLTFGDPAGAGIALLRSRDAFGAALGALLAEQISDGSAQRPYAIEIGVAAMQEMLCSAVSMAPSQSTTPFDKQFAQFILASLSDHSTSEVSAQEWEPTAA